MKFNLPKDHKPYIDKYFLRAKTILEKEGLNPTVKAQVFIRKGDCKVYGINEAIAILKKYSGSKKLKISALNEGDYFSSGEALMLIEAPIQDIIDLETMYLGVLSAETSKKSEDINIWTYASVAKNMKRIVNLVKPRPVSYFGARHWRYDEDAKIAWACKSGGAANCSTDAGAEAWGKDCKGIGTIPHALETIYHWRDGLKNAVSNATWIFNWYMDKNIPRIALVDYANREIQDSLKIAERLKHSKLYANRGAELEGIRIDTCGENYMQGAIPRKIADWLVANPDENINRYCFCKGVSIQGVYLVRKLLNDEGYKDVKIILSSGFGNPEKVRTFVEVEKILGMKLFDSLGVGGVFESRMATMDIIEVEGKEIHKVGRLPKDVSRLVKVM